MAEPGAILGSLLGLLIGLIFIITFIIYYLIAKYLIKDKYGNTASNVIQVFNKNLFRCSSWKTRTFFNCFTFTIERNCPGESNMYYLLKGEGNHSDEDTDDSMDGSFDFSIGKGKDGNLTILRSKN